MAENNQPQVVYIPDNGRKKASQKKNKRVTNAIIYVVLSLISIIWIIPFVLIVVESFRTFPLTQVGNPFYMSGIEFKWGFDNYAALFDLKQTNFLRWYGNTFLIAVVVAVVQTRDAVGHRNDDIGRTTVVVVSPAQLNKLTVPGIGGTQERVDLGRADLPRGRTVGGRKPGLGWSGRRIDLLL